MMGDPRPVGPKLWLLNLSEPIVFSHNGTLYSTKVLIGERPDAGPYTFLIHRVVFGVNDTMPLDPPVPLSIKLGLAPVVSLQELP